MPCMIKELFYLIVRKAEDDYTRMKFDFLQFRSVN